MSISRKYTESELLAMLEVINNAAHYGVDTKLVSKYEAAIKDELLLVFGQLKSHPYRGWNAVINGYTVEFIDDNHYTLVSPVCDTLRCNKTNSYRFPSICDALLEMYLHSTYHKGARANASDSRAQEILAVLR